MANAGTAPLDATTDIGRVRLVVGDTEATPTTGGQGDYAYFSDDAIQAALDLSGGGVTRAVSVLVKQLALSLTIAGQSIKADDFAINTLGKGKDLLEVARSYVTQADAEDAATARDEGTLAIVNTKLRPQNSWLGPESYPAFW
ncbi:hypothetical protein [Lacisediminihabitans changchengi]|uniref:Uncharacterized protein n=1 Tax=Lacisediminihabitans changchengi TaxID=2787634 RepID=A0A934VYN5_9MICO|nr:hypothetical protein [Lacisediminihabitans changchengi]MBK4348227.1 hypothetical protein [Lacisediminihabitans changchengi]